MAWPASMCYFFSKRSSPSMHNSYAHLLQSKRKCTIPACQEKVGSIEARLMNPRLGQVRKGDDSAGLCYGRVRSLCNVEI